MSSPFGRPTPLQWVSFCLLTFTIVSSAHAHQPIRVEYTTTDGVEIVGDYWTPIRTKDAAPVVILLHMYQSNRQAWRPQIVALEYAGFAIMSIDLRGHGDSVKPTSMNLKERVESRDTELFQAMHRDVAGAYQWLAERPEADLSRIALIGASVGCSVAIDYAQRDKSVDVAAVLSPGTKYLGIDSIAHIKRYGSRPLLILTSEQERGRGAATLYDLATESGVLIEQAVFSQTGIHGTRMYGKVDGIDKRIAAFLKEHVSAMPGEKVFAAIDGDEFFPEGHAAIKKIKPSALRIFSSAEEATKRGLRPAGK